MSTSFAHVFGLFEKTLFVFFHYVLIISFASVCIFRSHFCLLWCRCKSLFAKYVCIVFLMSIKFKRSNNFIFCFHFIILPISQRYMIQLRQIKHYNQSDWQGTHRTSHSRVSKQAMHSIFLWLSRVCMQALILADNRVKSI